MQQHEVIIPWLAENLTTDPEWDRTLVLSWPTFGKMSVGDGLIITGKDGVYLAHVEDIGDAELGENWITLEMM